MARRFGVGGIFYGSLQTIHLIHFRGAARFVCRTGVLSRAGCAGDGMAGWKCCRGGCASRCRAGGHAVTGVSPVRLCCVWGVVSGCAGSVCRQVCAGRGYKKNARIGRCRCLRAFDD